MHQHEECPVCGNKQITMYVEELIGKTYSVKTGKLLKVEGFKGTNCWDYKCRCGWVSDLYTE